MKPVNGYLTCKYGTMGLYVDGKKEGVHKIWYEKTNRGFCDSIAINKNKKEVGQLMQEANFLNGKYEGYFNEWHENGQLAKTISYKNGKKSGTQKEWSCKGQLSKIKNYLNGSMHGLSTEYDENGKIKTERQWLNGKVNGITTRWVGNRIAKHTYENGEYISTKTHVDEKLTFDKKIIGKHNSEDLYKVIDYDGKNNWRNF